MIGLKKYNYKEKKRKKKENKGMLNNCFCK